MTTMSFRRKAPDRRPTGRRMFTIVAALSMIAAACAAQPLARPVVPDEMAMGAPRAPVTVVEYASLGCPHCAIWEQQVFPAFKKTYIDTGKVRFVLKEMLFGNSTLAAAGFLTARCAGPGKYFQVVDAVFDQQTQIEQGGIDVLEKIAETAGSHQRTVSRRAFRIRARSTRYRRARDATSRTTRSPERRRLWSAPKSWRATRPWPLWRPPSTPRDAIRERATTRPRPCNFRDCAFRASSPSSTPRNFASSPA